LQETWLPVQAAAAVAAAAVVLPAVRLVELAVKVAEQLIWMLLVTW
jgi:hypothetical protein